MYSLMSLVVVELLPNSQDMIQLFKYLLVKYVFSWQSVLLVVCENYVDVVLSDKEFTKF